MLILDVLKLLIVFITTNINKKMYCFYQIFEINVE